jgi:hypothetical protein
MSCLRFESGLDFTQTTVQFCLGELSFANAAVPQRIHEDQVLIEGLVS